MSNKIYTLQMSELDVEILLKALGGEQIRCEDSRRPTKAVRILIERIYRAMGVRI